MNKCLSLGLLFAASFIGSLVLSSDVTKAQSQFDNAYQTTDNLFLRNQGSNQDTAADVKDNWIGFFHNNNPVNNKQILWRYNNQNYNYDDPFLQELIDDVLNTKSYIITNNKSSSIPAYDTVNFYVNENDEPFTVNFDIINGYPSVYTLADIGIIIRESNFAIHIDISTSSVRHILSNSNNTPIEPPGGGEYPAGISLFAIQNIGTVNYPENYIGPDIVDRSFTQEEDKTFLPEWTWSVTQDGKLTLTSQNNENANLDAEAVFDLWKDSKDWQFPSTQVVDSESQRPYHSAKFEHQLVKEEQWFTVTLQYHDQFCLMEGTCESEFPEDITHIETVIFQIYWDGKSFIAGNNANGQEDCELQEDGGIYRRICNAQEQEPVIMRTLRSINSDMHGLTQIITAPLSFISSLITYNDNCTALNLPLPSAMNRDINLPCMTPYYQQYLGFLFNLYQTILTALVCYYCFVNTLAYVKRGQNPKNDRIEVAHL